MNEGQQGRVTLRDVAKVCGVHYATVSAILHSTKSGTRFSRELETRVRDAAAKLGYTPNQAAQALRKNRAPAIGFWWAPDFQFDDPYYSRLLSGVKRGCVEANCQLVFPFASNSSGWSELRSWSSGGLITGLLYVGGLPEESASQLQGLPVPCASINRVAPGVASFLANHGAGARLMADHLAGLGHTRVLYLDTDIPAPAIREREAAFAAAFNERGGTVDRVQISAKSPFINSVRPRLQELGKQGGPTAVVGWNDTCAYRTELILLDMGLKIPGDVALCGFDGSVTVTRYGGRLTTVDLKVDQLAELAVSHVARGRTEVPEPVVLEPELIVGETT
jgi:DNA-binding LacI/PurR family transcriptional regulator